MSAPEMVLQYIETLKWPLITGGIVFWLRRPIVTLIGRIQTARIEAAGVSAELEARATEAADAIEAAPTPPGPAEVTAELHAGNQSGYGWVDFEFEHAELPIPNIRLAVRQASNLSVDDKTRIAAGLQRLDDVSGTGLDSIDRDVTPNKVIFMIWNQLKRAIAATGEKPQSVGARTPVLWPATPKYLYKVYNQLDLLHEMSRLTPDRVTPATAYEFDKAVRLWAAKYHVFVSSVLALVEAATQTGPTEFAEPDETG